MIQIVLPLSVNVGEEMEMRLNAELLHTTVCLKTLNRYPRECKFSEILTQSKPEWKELVIVVRSRSRDFFPTNTDGYDSMRHANLDVFHLMFRYFISVFRLPCVLSLASTTVTSFQIFFFLFLFLSTWAQISWSLWSLLWSLCSSVTPLPVGFRMREVVRCLIFTAALSKHYILSFLPLL